MDLYSNNMIRKNFYAQIIALFCALWYELTMGIAETICELCKPLMAAGA